VYERDYRVPLEVRKLGAKRGPSFELNSRALLADTTRRRTERGTRHIAFALSTFSALKPKINAAFAIVFTKPSNLKARRLVHTDLRRPMDLIQVELRQLPQRQNRETSARTTAG